MLSGEGNENGEKTTIGLIRKKATLHVQHTFCTFLYRCLARLQRETSRTFLVTRFVEEMSYLFLLIFFFTAAHFHLGGRYKISMLFFQQKMSSLSFMSRCTCLSLFFSLSFAGLSPTFSVSLSLSFSYSKFVDMTINLSFIL